MIQVTVRFQCKVQLRRRALPSGTEELGGDKELNGGILENGKKERGARMDHERLCYCVNVNRTSLDHLLLGKCADVDKTSAA
jgi:hypothetical protein